MNIDRLKHLITVLAAVPDKQFDIDNWKEHNSCGTVACALGWAGSDPQFKAEGLQLARPIFTPHFQGFTGYAAGAEFFGITREQSEYLFNPDEYESTYSEVEKVTPADVIARIEELLGDV